MVNCARHARYTHVYWQDVAALGIGTIGFYRGWTGAVQVLTAHGGQVGIYIEMRIMMEDGVRSWERKRWTFWPSLVAYLVRASG